jgi:hypothetical protein
MKPFTTNTYGLNHYFSKPKEHKTPKACKNRKGTRSGLRQRHKRLLYKQLTNKAD